MVRITFRKRRYIIAFSLTCFIFFIGFLLGFYFNQERIDYVTEIQIIQNLDYESMQLQYAYIDFVGERESCIFLSKTLEDSLLSLEDLRVKIEKYSTDFNLDDVEYDSLKRQYILAELKYWLLAKKTKEMCERDVVSLIYFYSIDDCEYCTAQSYILTSLKKSFGESLLVFSIDESFEKEPMVAILKEVYGVDEYPSLIIEDKAFKGLVEKEDLRKYICLELREDPELCN